MATDLVTATLDTSLWETARFMLERNIRHLPVLDGEMPITTISMRDVLGLVIEVLSKENESLRSDLQWVTYIYTQGT
jgi:CBS domain-containing protein